MTAYKSTEFFYFFKVTFKTDFTYLFLERGEGKEKERERNMRVWVPFTCSPAGDLACNPGICPDWESNQ